jgi:hypothetical protein
MTCSQVFCSTAPSLEVTSTHTSISKLPTAFPQVTTTNVNNNNDIDLSSEQQSQKPSSPIVYDGHLEWEVEKILDSKEINGRIEYYVKWVGYSDDLFWYLASNFIGSPHKLKKFHNQHPERPGPPRYLDYWVKCWENDINPNVHIDDDDTWDLWL